MALVLLPAASWAQTDVQRLRGSFRTFAQWQQTVEDITETGEAAVPGLLALLKQGSAGKTLVEERQDKNAKVAALTIIGELGTLTALDDLETILTGSESSSLMFNTARAIGNIGRGNTFLRLKRILHQANLEKYQQNQRVKQAAIIAMGLCEDQRGIEILTEELHNRNNDALTIVFAGGSLGLLGSAEGLPMAKEGLNATEPEVRLAAIRALGLIPSQDCDNLLQPYTTSDTKMVFRKTASLSLAQQQCRSLGADERADLIKTYIDQNVGVNDFIQWGTRALKKINSTKSITILEEFAQRKEETQAPLRHAARMKLLTLQ